MAVYHLAVKTISRAAGRSALAATAYRSGERLEGARTGDVHEPTGLAGLFGRSRYDQALTTWHTVAAWAKRREADLVKRLKKVREYLSPTYPKAEADAERKLAHRQPEAGRRVVAARAELMAQQVKARTEAQAQPRRVRSQDLER
jgi:hypothetical protein